MCYLLWVIKNNSKINELRFMSRDFLQVLLFQTQILKVIFPDMIYCVLPLSSVCHMMLMFHLSLSAAAWQVNKNLQCNMTSDSLSWSLSLNWILVLIVVPFHNTHRHNLLANSFKGGFTWGAATVSVLSSLETHTHTQSQQAFRDHCVLYSNAATLYQCEESCWTQAWQDVGNLEKKNTLTVVKSQGKEEEEEKGGQEEVDQMPP